MLVYTGERKFDLTCVLKDQLDQEIFKTHEAMKHQSACVRTMT